MTYSPNIPQATDIPSQSQAQLLTNFQQLNTIFDLNHVTYNDAAVADRGKHRFTTLIDQSPAPSTAANELAVYSAAVSGVSQLFFRRESNGSSVQLTGQDPVAAATGSAFLSGGVILKWGVFSFLNLSFVANPVFVTPFPTACFVVLLTDFNIVPNLNDWASVTSISAPSFTAQRISNGPTTQYYYLAIGN